MAYQIKTIRNRLDNVNRFDKDVNEAIVDGWILDRRIVVPGSAGSYTMLVAELHKSGNIRFDIADDPKNTVESD